MTLGLVTGCLINTLTNDAVFIQEYLVDGLFHVVGSIFINVLKMLVIPLLTFSLICGVCSIGDVAILRRVGTKTFLLFMLTTALATTLAMTVAVIVQPGQGFDITQIPQNTLPPPPVLSWTQVFIDLIPGNPIAAYVEGNMLQIIFFTILFSVCVLMIGERGKLITEFAEKLNVVMMQVVNVVMRVAPIGIFALMAKTFSEQGLSLISPMISYFGLVAVVLIFHATGTLMLLLKLFGHVSPLMFMKKMRSTQMLAFSTASSNATIPITLHTAKKRLGIDHATASFVVPFGATLNMDGTAITHGVATVFIANVYGIDLGIIDYLTVVAMTILASIGTAGIPGLGLAMLAMVFSQVGLPIEGIALILVIDRILDMMRTAVNVTGDVVVSMIVARSERNISMKVFNNPDAGQEEVHLASS
ncbi:MAG: dicarboxylate/amino acid:cation symporter [Gammaproteobacteria bacterium]|nr:dicarboxylate/amino acid:cation symporter [Gammaproteobacteria bacterium]